VIRTHLTSVSAAEEKVVGEVVKFSGLKMKRFGNKADLNFGVGILLLT
jgi:hypothetical protein